VPVAAFREAFGSSPEVAVRAPGRVNLIGEHTDYALLPVLPAAVQFGVTVAAGRASPGTMRAVSASFPDAPVDFDGLPAVPPEGWARYLWGVLAVLGDRAAGGAAVRVGGDLPADGGLSSSSALTVGLLGALDVLWDLGLGRDELVGLAVRAERSVGIEGGTMDQTVIAFAEAGAALRIDFAPPGRRPVPLPEAVRIVAADSGRRAPKTGAMRDLYDGRVVGGRVAAALLGNSLGVEAGRPPVLGRLGDPADLLGPASGLPAQATGRRAAGWSGLDTEDLCRLSSRVFPPDLPVPVRSTAVHMLSEARRVDEAEAAIEAGDAPGLGRLFDESHESLGRFGVSTPELDALAAVLRDAGACGARLTGAGGGGYVVAVAAPGAVAEVEQAGRSFAGTAFEVVPSEGMRWFDAG
jgi:galactokinase